MKLKSSNQKLYNNNPLIKFQKIKFLGPQCSVPVHSLVYNISFTEERKKSVSKGLSIFYNYILYKNEFYLIIYHFILGNAYCINCSNDYIFASFYYIPNQFCSMVISNKIFYV